MALPPFTVVKVEVVSMALVVVKEEGVVVEADRVVVVKAEGGGSWHHWCS